MKALKNKKEWLIWIAVILFTLLVFASVCNAQERYINPVALEYNLGIEVPRSHKNAIVSTSFNLCSATLGGFGDGFNHEGQKVLGHSLKALEILTLFGKYFLFDDIDAKLLAIDLLNYTGARFMVYDLAYNQARGLDYWYYGNTSLYDKAIRVVDPGPQIMWMKGIYATFTISFTFNNME